MNDRQYAVLSAMGTDRPGLVSEVSRILTECGCNLEDSRMAALGGEFGLMILFSGPEAAVQQVLDRESDLEATCGLRAAVKRTLSPVQHRREALLTYEIEASGLDHEGIVHAMTDTLHELGANIVSLTTLTYSAPVTGSPLFRMEATADVPATASTATFKARLAEVADAANLDLTVRVA